MVHDDGGVISGEKNLVAIWNILLEETPKLGLELNPSKCEWSWLDPGCTKACPIRVPGDQKQQIELVPRDEIAEKFDKQIWDAAQNILGLQIPEEVWKQACLTPRLGGLGLRRIVDHAERFLGE
jgi:hypothetical protein